MESNDSIEIIHDAGAIAAKDTPNGKKRKIAVLHDDHGAGTSRSPVVLASHIRVDAAKRSELLSAISSTPGSASLPKGISIDDIRLWQAAGTGAVTDRLSASEVAKVFQVRFLDLSKLYHIHF